MSSIKTNTELIDDLMNFSDHGALMQVFIIEAVRQYSDWIMKNDLSGWNNSFINPEAWKGCAEEFINALNERDGHGKEQTQLA